MTGNTKYHMIYYISFSYESYRTILCEKMPLIKKLYGKSKHKPFNLVNTVIIMTNKKPKWLFLDSLQEWSMYYMFLQ